MCWCYCYACTQIVYVTICGWAYAFMTTVIPVSKGHELLYAYGHGYWNYAATGIAQCERDKELLQKEKQLKVCVGGSCLNVDCQ